MNRIPRRGSVSARVAETTRLRLAAANRFPSGRYALGWAAIALGILAHPAYAATIVEMRVGSHPEFTRVVFQLDEPAGYRIERKTRGDGGGEIVVTINAATRPRSIRSRSSLIELVTVEEILHRAVARIRLRNGGLNLREMILSEPPRIVLDVMRPTRAAATSKPTRSPRATRRPAVLPAEPPPKPEPEVVSEPVVVQEPPPPVQPADEIVLEPTTPAVAPEPEPEPVLVVETPRSLPAPEPEPEPALVAETLQSPPAPEPVRVAVDDDDGGIGLELPFGVTPLKAGIAGLLLTVAGVSWVIRRRSLPRDVDVTFLDPADAEGGLAGRRATNSRPPSGAEATEETGVSPNLTSDQPGPLNKPERRESDMQPDTQPDTQDLRSQSGQVQAPVGTADSGGGPDVTRLLQEMQQRLANLESRLDQSIEAREQLEQQVAAQSEELRVQRAAIARTQRALRGMARPEEDATEPALKRRGGPGMPG